MMGRENAPLMGDVNRQAAGDDADRGEWAGGLWNQWFSRWSNHSSEKHTTRSYEVHPDLFSPNVHQLHPLNRR